MDYFGIDREIKRREREGEREKEVCKYKQENAFFGGSNRLLQ